MQVYICKECDEDDPCFLVVFRFDFEVMPSECPAKKSGEERVARWVKLVEKDLLSEKEEV